MAFSLVLHCSPKLYKPQTLTQFNSHFVSSSNAILRLKQPSFQNRLKTHQPPSRPLVLAAQSNFVKVVRTIWKVGKDGIEAGTNLVPDSVPRPVARISVTVVALAVSLFVLKSFLSTAFFVLATMGLAYFIFIALNKDQAPTPRGGSGSSSSSSSSSSSDSIEDPLEEARRIMEKYNIRGAAERVEDDKKR